MTGKSWTAWAQKEWAGLSGSEVSTLLWQCTSYPLGTLEQVEAEFRAIRDRAGGDVLTALEQAADRAEREFGKESENGQQKVNGGAAS